MSIFHLFKAILLLINFDMSMILFSVPLYVKLNSSMRTQGIHYNLKVKWTIKSQYAGIYSEFLKVVECLEKSLPPTQCWTILGLNMLYLSIDWWLFSLYDTLPFIRPYSEFHLRYLILCSMFVFSFVNLY